MCTFDFSTNLTWISTFLDSGLGWHRVIFMKSEQLHTSKERLQLTDTSRNRGGGAWLEAEIESTRNMIKDVMSYSNHIGF